MKVISIRNPWANLIVRGIKPVENRTWKTDYRGPLLIHASKKFDFGGLEWIYKHFPESLALGDSLLFRGGIIGEVEMVDCVSSYLSPWFFGPYGFLFKNAEELPFIPLRGKLGLFKYKGEIGQI
jgi:hypothetical protein